MENYTKIVNINVIIQTFKHLLKELFLLTSLKVYTKN